MLAGRMLASITIAVVVTAIVAGLLVSGSPLRQRELRTDQRRVNDLSRLTSAVSQYYRETREVPDTLAQLVNGRMLSSLPRDPISAAPYRYARATRARVSLCAVFARESGEAPGDFWYHAAGEQCFEFDYSDMRLD
jgi:type II secretory pathway pseudopilin PulG